MVFSSKQAVAAGTATHKEATQAMHNGLNGMIHTAVQAGHTAIAAPDCIIGIRKRKVNNKAIKIILLFGILFIHLNIFEKKLMFHIVNEMLYIFYDVEEPTYLDIECSKSSGRDVLLQDLLNQGNQIIHVAIWLVNVVEDIIPRGHVVNHILYEGYDIAHVRH